MADANTFVCVHTVKYNGTYYRPGQLVTIAEPREVERLLACGAIMRPVEFTPAVAVRRGIPK